MYLKSSQIKKINISKEKKIKSKPGEMTLIFGC